MLRGHSTFLHKESYRPDIDGLRAVAVLSVVSLHFRLSGFTGGFVGVDIFFVISGYLITSIIVGSLERGSFSFAGFYERRIRRIIPAFIFMLAVVSVACIAVYPPRELAQFGRSAAAAAAFCANIYFAHKTDYFAGSETLIPLLHTWSLGVEEQFYILWPLLLFVGYRIGSRLAVGALVVILLAASFIYSDWGMLTKNANELFYLPQARAWELMIGAVLALGMVPKITSRWLREGLALLGIGAIAFAVAQFSSSTPFPGRWALIPCLGAMLIIHTGQDRDTAVYRSLSVRPLVFVGLISYSLYLWHWPVVAFAENYIGHPLSLDQALVLIVASIAIAAASWRFVEQPFRLGQGRAILSRPVVFAGGLGGLALAGLAGFAIYLGGGMPWRLSPDVLRFYLASSDHNAFRPYCLYQSAHNPTEASRCTSPAGEGYDVVVWGDSHGDALFPAIASIGQRHGLATRQVTKRGCPPLLGVEIVDQGRRAKPGSCEKYNNAMLQELEQGPKPRLVVLVARWSMYTETTTDMAGGRRVFTIDDKDRTYDIETSREVVSRALRRTIDAVTGLGIRVLLIGQPPEFFQDPNICFVERKLLHRGVGDCFSQPRSIAFRRLGPSEEILLKAARRRPAATYVNLASILCDKEMCRTEDSDEPLYEDKNHLDLSGAHFVGKAFSETPGLVRLFDARGSSYALNHSLGD